MTGARARRSARLAAMDLLARREHARSELRDKLLARDFPADEVAAALDALAAEGLQSDARFVEAFVRSRLGRGQGPLRILAELRQRAVAPELVDGELAAAGIDWTAQAREARERRFGPGRPADWTERARQARFLAQRGFSSEQVRGALGADDDN